ncbi:ABC transporter ATP-binding protein [Gordonia jinhuaensis]|uniref:Aliphatic sulfonate ABC transporter ATP-binding protein n=1 Tax=Gordonia jinhuaensis TaxID=1517702 RepID=A0A916T4U7_9ACTN|nr:ABC transporter ATP-binding protein [Gordonia jinhuaensis]GGB30843.1 aliphatic sulfonate ABC transporter ATP-binding protein [Gordonia jinhuaensis]
MTTHVATGEGRADTAAAGAAEPSVAVRIRHLSKHFDDKSVISDLDLTIADGEFVVLLGKSGCGKSTLLRILAGLDDAIDGEVTVPRRRAVGFQAPRLMPWKKVWRNVVLGLPGRADRALAQRYLAEVGLADSADVWPKTLSGGQAQRVSLARALVREPDLLLLDEPFGALDALTRVTAQRLVADLWRSHGCAVLLVTHDVEEALVLADRILVMDSGRIAHEVELNLPRPRDISTPEFLAVRRDILASLGALESTH